MAEDDAANLLLLAHLRRIAIGGIVDALPPETVGPAISAAIQRLAQYGDEGAVQTIAHHATPEQFLAALDLVISELRGLTEHIEQRVTR
jgi:hypothetical protein